MIPPFTPADPEPDPFGHATIDPSATSPGPAVDPATDSWPMAHTALEPDRRRGRRGSRLGPILAASLLSATLASTGTALLTRQLTPPPVAAPAATVGTATTTSTTTVQATDLTAIVAAARASVVTITADGLSTSQFSPFGQPTSGVGSGIVLTANGYILTNRHVVEN